ASTRTERVTRFDGERRRSGRSVIERIRQLRVAGAMAVGTPTACRALVGRLPGCVVIDTDILSTEMVATTQPEPDYERFHDVLLQLALEIGAQGLSALYTRAVHRG